VGAHQPRFVSKLAGLACANTRDGVGSGAALARSQRTAGPRFSRRDRRIAVGLYYRLADGREAAGLCSRFTRFVTRETLSLKLVAEKLLEAMPRAASKARALRLLKARIPASWVAVYFGDDATDEDAFAILAEDDLGVHLGVPSENHAKFW
jgi:trehalose-6-phosphatase